MKRTNPDGHSGLQTTLQNPSMDSLPKVPSVPPLSSWFQLLGVTAEDAAIALNRTAERMKGWQSGRWRKCPTKEDAIKLYRFFLTKLPIQGKRPEELTAANVYLALLQARLGWIRSLSDEIHAIVRNPHHIALVDTLANQMEEAKPTYPEGYDPMDPKTFVSEMED